MPSNPENRGFTFTLTDEGHIDTIRGISVPDGVIAAPDLADVPPASRDVTPRAIQMTAGIFEFAKLVNRPDPKEATK